MRLLKWTAGYVKYGGAEQFAGSGVARHHMRDAAISLLA
jgi:hypothetical protein